MFPFPLSGLKERIVAVADVDGASAGVAIMRVGTSDTPSIILAAARSSLPLEKRTQAQAGKLVALALADASHKALSAYRKTEVHEPPREIYCIARPPWMETGMFEGHASYEQDIRITKELIKDLAQSVLTQGRQGGEAPAEAQVVGAELNGYPTNVPDLKLARSIRIAVMTSDIEHSFREDAEHALGAAFPGRRVLWRSRVRALLTFARTHMGSIRNCLIADIGLAGTSLITIRKGIIEARAELDDGLHRILEQVAQGGMPEETLATIRGLETDTCSASQCKSINEGLSKAEQHLVPIFGERLGALATPRRLPNTLILLCHNDLTPWLSRFFGRIDFAQFTTTTLPFSVIVPDSKVLSGLVSVADGIRGDTPILFACALIHSELRHSHDLMI